jgi:hypothetical protein
MAFERPDRGKEMKEFGSGLLPGLVQVCEKTSFFGA